MKHVFLISIFSLLYSDLFTQRVSLSPVEFDESIKELKELNQKFILLDVRTNSEFKTGYLEDAVLLDWTSDEFKSKFKELAIQKDIPIYIYCYMGGRSAEAADYIKNLGYTQVFDMKGGIYQWKMAGLPVKKKSNQ